jgi:hypothetical protein
MRTPQADSRQTSNSEIVGVCARPDFHQTVGASASILALGQAVGELGIDATWNDIVRRAQSIETAIIQRRSHQKRSLCVK